MAAKSIEEVLLEEAEAIHGTAILTAALSQDQQKERKDFNADKRKDADPESEALEPRYEFYRALNQLNRAALCCSGGGIRSAEDARAVLRAGADKITLNTAAVGRPELISETSLDFGAQAIVLAIDAKREGDHWTVMVRGGRESANRDAIEWAKQGVALGAGEILLTSMDRDGTKSGFDIALTAAISSAVSVPVIASGGAKLPAHFAEIFTAGRADAALAASIFHDNIQPIRELKEFLAACGVPVRLPC